MKANLDRRFAGTGNVREGLADSAKNDARTQVPERFERTAVHCADFGGPQGGRCDAADSDTDGARRGIDYADACGRPARPAAGAGAPGPTRNYIPRGDAERIAADYFKSPILIYGQGEYQHNYDAESALWPLWAGGLAFLVLAAAAIVWGLTL